MPAIDWNLDAERELWAAICAPNRWHDAKDKPTTHPRSLWYFVHIAWGAEWYFRSGKTRWLTERVHAPYLEWLQKQRLEWQASRRAGINERWYVASIIPRGFGKTVTTTKAGSLWMHLDEPDMPTVIFSEIREKAVDFLGPIKDVLANEDGNSWFCWLYGMWYTPERQWLKHSIKHAYRNATLSEPSYGTAGIDGGITGYHPMDCECDDPLSINKLKEEGTWLETAHTAVNAIYPALAQDGWLCLTLTRYLDDDIAGRHLKEEGVMEWNGMDPPNRSFFEKHAKGTGVWRVYFLQAEDRDGNPVLPEVMTAKKIAFEKARNADEFARDYMNDPSSSEAVPLTEAQLTDMLLDRAKLREIPIAFASVHIDTAFKSPQTVRKGDYSAIVVFLHDMRTNGIVYFDRALVSNEWRDFEFMDKLGDVLLDLRARNIWVKAITDETEMGGKTELFKNRLIATIRGLGLQQPRIYQFPRQGTRKEQRIRTAAGFWADGYVRLLCPTDSAGKFLIASAPGLKECIKQMSRIGHSEFDDIADAAADVWAPGVWVKPSFETLTAMERGDVIRQAGDEILKGIGRPPSIEEARALYDERNGMPGRNEPEWMPPRSPV